MYKRVGRKKERGRKAMKERRKSRTRRASARNRDRSGNDGKREKKGRTDERGGKQRSELRWIIRLEGYEVRGEKGIKVCRLEEGWKERERARVRGNVSTRVDYLHNAA